MRKKEVEDREGEQKRCGTDSEEVQCRRGARMKVREEEKGEESRDSAAVEESPIDIHLAVNGTIPFAGLLHLHDRTVRKPKTLNSQTQRQAFSAPPSTPYCQTHSPRLPQHSRHPRLVQFCLHVIQPNFYSPNFKPQIDRSTSTLDLAFCKRTLDTQCGRAFKQQPFVLVFGFERSTLNVDERSSNQSFVLTLRKRTLDTQCGRAFKQQPFVLVFGFERSTLNVDERSSSQSFVLALWTPTLDNPSGRAFNVQVIDRASSTFGLERSTMPVDERSSNQQFVLAFGFDRSTLSVDERSNKRPFVLAFWLRPLHAPTFVPSTPLMLATPLNDIRTLGLNRSTIRLIDVRQIGMNPSIVQPASLITFVLKISMKLFSIHSDSRSTFRSSWVSTARPYVNMSTSAFAPLSPLDNQYQRAFKKPLDKPCDERSNGPRVQPMCRVSKASSRSTARQSLRFQTFGVTCGHCSGLKRSTFRLRGSSTIHGYERSNLRPLDANDVRSLGPNRSSIKSHGRSAYSVRRFARHRRQTVGRSASPFGFECSTVPVYERPIIRAPQSFDPADDQPSGVNNFGLKRPTLTLPDVRPTRLNRSAFRGLQRPAFCLTDVAAPILPHCRSPLSSGHLKADHPEALLNPADVRPRTPTCIKGYTPAGRLVRRSASTLDNQMSTSVQTSLDIPCFRAFKKCSPIQYNERPNITRKFISTSVQEALTNACQRAFKHRSQIHINKRSRSAGQCMSTSVQISLDIHCNERSNTARQSTSTSARQSMFSSLQEVGRSASRTQVHERSTFCFLSVRQPSFLPFVLASFWLIKRNRSVILDLKHSIHT
ncbi:hypothetical protein LR48_Vigan661s002400 [Vigna angularis]|uniref:Uncharacterized protein n=1 Tax=Phaseolus angularis TaxID=3914 RepID=A0A0L9TG06_PHAAN|nr:hypothetical protein LR48_Vigan661s002400 [Vigna angularis]